MKLGPDGFTGIALLGTASSSMELAPFKDPKWSIWACSPGTYPICAKNRSDVFFEVHRWMPTPPGMFGAPGTKPWFSPEFHEFLRNHKGPVFMSQKEPLIPNSERIPFEHLIGRYGPYFWTSSVAYMIAMAIDELEPRARAGEQVAIGMWGIDMAASEEYAYQRPACQHFIGLAMSLGIHIVLPQESDLMRPTTMYGIGELNPRHIRLSARRADLAAQQAHLQQQVEAGTRQLHTLGGQIAEVDYVLTSWSDDIAPDLKSAVAFSSEFVKPVGDAMKATDSTGAAVVEISEAARV